MTPPSDSQPIPSAGERGPSPANRRDPALMPPNPVDLERRLQWRVGLFTLMAFVVASGMLLHFGELGRLWQKSYAVSVSFEHATGIYPTASVTLFGLSIGQVRSVRLDDRNGGVVAVIDVRAEFRLRADSRVRVQRGLLGDSTLVVEPGRSEAYIKPNGRLLGIAAVDAMEIVNRMEDRANALITSIHGTTEEWRRVGANMNGLMESKHGDIEQIISRGADALTQLTSTLQQTTKFLATTNAVLGDPASQAALKQTLTGLPELMNETRATISTSRRALDAMERNLTNLDGITEPLARRGESLANKLDGSLGQLELMLRELSQFSRAVNSEDGTLRKLAEDPSLYQNLDRSTQSLAVLLKNLEPILRDVAEFSDKIARRPEILGVGGAMRPSTGMKDEELLEPSRNRVTPAGRSTSSPPKR